MITDKYFVFTIIIVRLTNRRKCSWPYTNFRLWCSGQMLFYMTFLSHRLRPRSIICLSGPLQLLLLIFPATSMFSTISILIILPNNTVYLFIIAANIGSIQISMLDNQLNSQCMPPRTTFVSSETWKACLVGTCNSLCHNLQSTPPEDSCGWKEEKRKILER